MGEIYIMSDIHGFYRDFVKRLDQLGNLHTVIDEGGKDKLILLGDYIDEGENSFRTLNLIFSLQQVCPERFIVLKGNHEAWFLDFLEGREDTWLGADVDLKTSRTFLTEEQIEQVKAIASADGESSVYAFIRNCIRTNHGELIAWMKSLPCYYETETQLFVHAGIDEEAGEWWEWGSSENIFLNKYPAETGAFYKDIIAGHVGTASIRGDKNSHDIFWDGASHYYCDGTVAVSRKIPVLVYDEEEKKYYSLGDDIPIAQRNRDNRFLVRGELRPLQAERRG